MEQFLPQSLPQNIYDQLLGSNPDESRLIHDLDHAIRLEEGLAAKSDSAARLGPETFSTIYRNSRDYSWQSGTPIGLPLLHRPAKGCKTDPDKLIRSKLERWLSIFGLKFAINADLSPTVYDPVDFIVTMNDHVFPPSLARDGLQELFEDVDEVWGFYQEFPGRSELDHDSTTLLRLDDFIRRNDFDSGTVTFLQNLCWNFTMDDGDGKQFARATCGMILEYGTKLGVSKDRIRLSLNSFISATTTDVGRRSPIITLTIDQSSLLAMALDLFCKAHDLDPPLAFREVAEAINDGLRDTLQPPLGPLPDLPSPSPSAST